MENGHSTLINKEREVCCSYAYLVVRNSYSSIIICVILTAAICTLIPLCY